MIDIATLTDADKGRMVNLASLPAADALQILPRQVREWMEKNR